MWAAAAAAAGQIAGASIEQNSKNSAAKRAQNIQFLQNLWLQQRQIEWEKERATHAHQWEMQDLKDANLNPALTATGGQGAATGSISAPSSAVADTQGLQIGNLVQQLVEMRNNTKATNASANLQDAQALKTLTENKYIPKNYKVDMMNAISNRISANANQTNAVTNQNSNNAGAWKWLIGAEGGKNTTQNIRNIPNVIKNKLKGKPTYNKKDFYKNVMFE